MKVFLNLFFALFVISLFSQNIELKGKVTDILQVPLGSANILAVPENENVDIAFAISLESGIYKLNLRAHETYNITVSYLGYKPFKFTTNTSIEDVTKNFQLEENLDRLDEVTINYTPPVVIKKDTITYKVDTFITGEERKLREVLKKLPGVEVDKAGNVKVRGKTVTKVLVENKIFFTGDSKLAVNNIPADAVDKIEILDNYNAVAMLKGLQDSEDMAMNIRLKEDKKKFTFGDVEVGAGVKNRYIIHPNLFYYSPRTNINFIGDLNNQGVKSFSFRDYLEFEGGFSKLINNSGSYSSLRNNDFSKYLANNDYKENTNQFGALNIRQALNSDTDISGYVITSKGKTETERNTTNEYLNTEDFITEERTVSGNFNNFFTIAKLALEFSPSFNQDLKYNSFVKFTNNSSNGIINSLYESFDNSIVTSLAVRGLSLKQNLSYSRKLSKNHTGTLEATYSYQNDKPVSEWLTDSQSLEGLIPLQDDSIYNILQRKKTYSHDMNAIVKDYWVLNGFNHLYTAIGFTTEFSSFYNQDYQKLTNGAINDFDVANFGNNFKYNFIDTFLGLEYKFQIGKAVFKPMLYYHFYNWQTTETGNVLNNHKSLLLPQFTAKMEFDNGEKLNFKYALNARFPAINQLANNFILSSFNSVFKGDVNLENQLYHRFSLSYYKFSLFRGVNFNVMSSFTKELQYFKSVTSLDGINQFNTVVLLNNPEQNLFLRGDFSKKINKIKYSFKGNFMYSDFYQIVNNQTNLNVSRSMSSTVSIETFFKKHPNIEIGFTKAFNNYRSASFINNFENDNFFVDLEYDFLKNFIFKANYSLDNYTNKLTKVQNNFDVANASLFYNAEDSPWGYEFSATNLFDINFKQSNAFNSYLISDTKTYILPRIIMFKLSYKL